MFEKLKVIENLKDLEHCPSCGSGDIGFSKEKTYVKFYCKDCNYKWDVLTKDEVHLIRQEAVEEFIKARKR